MMEAESEYRGAGRAGGRQKAMSPNVAVSWALGQVISVSHLIESSHNPWGRPPAKVRKEGSERGIHSFKDAQLVKSRT